jgi:hypothetical protein
MAALVRFVDAKEKKTVFINPNHIRIVKVRSDGGAEIVLDDKISIFVVESPDAVIKALEPIRKLLESDESDVIRCWALDSPRSARCGHPNTAALRTATACVTRVI